MAALTPGWNELNCKRSQTLGHCLTLQPWSGPVLQPIGYQSSYGYEQEQHVRIHILPVKWLAGWVQSRHLKIQIGQRGIRTDSTRWHWKGKRTNSLVLVLLYSSFAWYSELLCRNFCEEVLKTCKSKFPCFYKMGKFLSSYILGHSHFFKMRIQIDKWTYILDLAFLS